MYFDNFYTSVPLVNRLYEMGFLACGTSLTTRKTFPKTLKDKVWGRKAERGDMRYIREGRALCLQWKDNKVL